MTEQTLKIQSRTEQLIAVRDFISMTAREFGFSDEEVSKIALAVDEACTNIIKHAYRFDPSGELTIRVMPSKAAFTITIHDNGRQFNPAELHAPDMKEYLTHFQRGGLGVYLMKRLMDKVEYNIVPGKMNEVRLTKFLTR